MQFFSVVIIAYNNERTIRDVLSAACSVSNDVIVVDSYSNDQTVSICEEYKVRVEQRAWSGYSDQKNYANTLAQHDWILSLDADEVLSTELISTLTHSFSPESDAVYAFSFRNIYCGKWIRYGRWGNEKHIRLFNRNVSSWNDKDVHEGLTHNKAVKTDLLKGSIIHYSMPNMEVHIQKVNRYSSLAAMRLFKAGKKATFIKQYVNPPFRFLMDYVFRFGFLDGFYGYSLAKICAFETYLKYAKLKELYDNENRV